MDKLYPVWVNRDVPLYITELKTKQRFLVLTSKGPIAAKFVAEHAGKSSCIRSNQVNIPLFAGHIREIEQVLDGNISISRIEKNGLRIWLIESTLKSNVKMLMVWTAKGERHAGSIALMAIPGGHVTKITPVPEPIIVCEYEDAEKVLQSA